MSVYYSINIRNQLIFPNEIQICFSLLRNPYLMDLLCEFVVAVDCQFGLLNHFKLYLPTASKDLINFNKIF